MSVESRLERLESKRTRSPAVVVAHDNGIYTSNGQTLTWAEVEALAGKVVILRVVYDDKSGEAGDVKGIDFAELV